MVLGAVVLASFSRFATVTGHVPPSLRSDFCLRAQAGWASVWQTPTLEFGRYGVLDAFGLGTRGLEGYGLNCKAELGSKDDPSLPFETLRVQVPNNHILTQNQYSNSYYPKPKYQIVTFNLSALMV